MRRELARKGIREERIVDFGFHTHVRREGDRRHFAFGDDSFMTYLLHRRQGTPGCDEKLVTLAAEVERLPPMRPDRIKAPAWQWDDRKPVAEIDSLPPPTPVVHWPVRGGPAATMRDDIRQAVSEAVKRKGKNQDSEAKPPGEQWRWAKPRQREAAGRDWRRWDGGVPGGTLDADAAAGGGGHLAVICWRGACVVGSSRLP